MIEYLQVDAIPIKRHWINGKWKLKISEGCKSVLLIINQTISIFGDIYQYGTYQAIRLQKTLVSPQIYKMINLCDTYLDPIITPTE